MQIEKPPRKLLDQVSDALRIKPYSLRTEKTYIEWIRRYILFHEKRHPKDMGAEEIQAFITHLATQRIVSASTQNQALSAIMFLYRHILQKEIAAHRHPPSRKIQDSADRPHPSGSDGSPH